MFTKSIGVELIKYGINVNCIAPGLVYTKILSRYSDKDIEGFNRKIPAGRGGQPEEIVPMVLFFADKSKSSFIVGQTFTSTAASPSTVRLTICWMRNSDIS